MNDLCGVVRRTRLAGRDLVATLVVSLGWCAWVQPADAAVAAANEPLANPPEGTWTGRRYTCRYSYGDGDLVYTWYDWFKQRIMRVRGEGGDTDLTRDYEYTDWEAVDEFARDVAELVGSETRSAS